MTEEYVTVSGIILDDIIKRIDRTSPETLRASLKELGASVQIGQTEDDNEAQAQTNEDEYIASLFVGSHTPVIVDSVCPLCGFVKAESYEGHGPLLRCANPGCKKTYDPTVEGVGYVMTHEEEDADTQAED